mgnify:FL=1
MQRYLDVSRCGSRIVSGSWDKTVRIWEAKTGVPLFTLEGHSDNVRSVCFSPNGAHIVSGAYDKTALMTKLAVRVWDAKTGKLVSTMEGHSDNVPAVCFSPNGLLILSGSSDKTIRVWDHAKHLNRQEVKTRAVYSSHNN